MKLKRILFFLLAALIGPQCLYAQFLWQLHKPDFDGRYSQAFDAIDCYRNVCLAAGTIVDNTEKTIDRVFWRSIDGGLTWTIQPSGLPRLFDFRTNEARITYFNDVQQIDSLNAVAVGIHYLDSSSSILLRTIDGGVSWKQQNIYDDTGAVLQGQGMHIYFSDPQNGIILFQENDVQLRPPKPPLVVIGGGPQKIYTTSDGGNHWNVVKIEFNSNIGDCFTTEYGEYVVCGRPRGPIYHTVDNWKNVDTLSIMDQITNDLPEHFQFTQYNFIGRDTMIAYGHYYHYGDLDSSQGIIMRSIDGGKHWEKPTIFETLWDVSAMSSLGRDTILAGGPSFNKILMSTNRGETWRVDSLVLDTAYKAYFAKGIVFTASGNPLASYASVNIGLSIPSILIRGEYSKRRVDWNGSLHNLYHQRVFPNPATTELNLASIEVSTPFRIYDLLGRVAMSGMSPDHGLITLDISTLTKGVYFVFVDAPFDGHPVFVGKVMIVEK